MRSYILAILALGFSVSASAVTVEECIVDDRALVERTRERIENKDSSLIGDSTPYVMASGVMVGRFGAGSWSAAIKLDKDLASLASCQEVRDEVVRRIGIQVTVGGQMSYTKTCYHLNTEDYYIPVFEGNTCVKTVSAKSSRKLKAKALGNLQQRNESYSDSLNDLEIRMKQIKAAGLDYQSGWVLDSQYGN